MSNRIIRGEQKLHHTQVYKRAVRGDNTRLQKVSLGGEHFKRHGTASDTGFARVHGFLQAQGSTLTGAMDGDGHRDRQCRSELRLL